MQALQAIVMHSHAAYGYAASLAWALTSSIRNLYGSISDAMLGCEYTTWVPLRRMTVAGTNDSRLR